MKKLFVSQPMNGKSRKEIKRNMEDALAIAKMFITNEDVKLIDNYFINLDKTRKHADCYYLGKALQLLSKADIVFMYSGWDKAGGCRIEFQAAITYGLDIMFREEYKGDLDECTDNIQ